MPNPLLLCLQLTFHLNTGFKGVTEEPRKQTKNYLPLHLCCNLRCIRSRSRGEVWCVLQCWLTLSQSQEVGRAPADLLVHVETLEGTT